MTCAGQPLTTQSHSSQTCRSQSCSWNQSQKKALMNWKSGRGMNIFNLQFTLSLIIFWFSASAKNQPAQVQPLPQLSELPLEQRMDRAFPQSSNSLSSLFHQMQPVLVQ